MVFFITHINILLLYHFNEISKYFFLFGNSTCSRIYSFIARKRSSSINSTNSTNQIAPQQNQTMTLTTQALMKVNIVELKDALMKVNLAIVDGNLKEALTDVRDIESQLLQVKPMPTKFLDNIHKAINAIAREDINKALNTLTGIQVTILKAENQIFKAAVANPQMMQQFAILWNQTLMKKKIIQIKKLHLVKKKILQIKKTDKFFSVFFMEFLLF